MRKADAFSVAAISEILELPCHTHEELRDVCCVITSCFTSFRAEDMHGCLSNMVTLAPAERDNVRRVVFQLERTKNDPEGTGPVKNRTFVVPCTCMSSMEPAQKRSFAAALKKNPEHNCPDPCPYAIIKRYLEACPTPPPTTPTEVPSRVTFMRALTARGQHRTLTLGILGINEIKKATLKVNARLSPELQLSRATGHTGRQTLTSVVMNNGGDAVHTAATTKHRDLNQLAGYAAPNHGLLSSAGLTMGNAITAHRDTSTFAGVSIQDVTSTFAGASTHQVQEASTSSANISSSSSSNPAVLAVMGEGENSPSQVHNEIHTEPNNEQPVKKQKMEIQSGAKVVNLYFNF